MGTKCQYFHPRMCSSSITITICFNDKCSFVHVKKTKRTRPQITRETMKKDPNGNKSNILSQKDFLDLFHNFKVEILNIVDTKLKKPVEHQTQVSQMAQEVISQKSKEHPIPGIWNRQDRPLNQYQPRITNPHRPFHQWNQPNILRPAMA